MEAQPKRTSEPQFSELERLARGFNFFRLVSELGRMGFFGPEKLEIVANPARTFPGSDVESLELVEGTTGGPEKARMVVNFWGLMGVHATIPTYFQDIIESEGRTSDPELDRRASNLRLLFNLIENRVYQLIYRIWDRTTPVYGSSESLRAGVQNPTLSMVGLGHVTSNMRINLLRALPYMMQTSRNAWGLANLLHEFLHVVVVVHEFEELTVPVSPGERFRLGKPETAVLGKNMRVVQHRITKYNAVRIELGPLTLDELLELLPGGKPHALLVYLTTSYLPIELEYNLDLVLSAEEVSSTEFKLGSPRLRLGASSILRPSRRTKGVRLRRRGLSPASSPSDWRQVVESFQRTGDDPVSAA